MQTCIHCEAALPDGSNGNRRYCGNKCRDAAQWQRRLIRDPGHWIGRSYPARDKPCSTGCGAMVNTNPSSPAKSAPTCRTCRAKRPKRTHLERYGSPCIDCGSESLGIRCRACANKAQIVRSPDDPGILRHQRESAAPGLTSTQRSKLLAKWKRQGKRCTYCPEMATTVDHVVPLVRGGTNHEGNLTPCCKRCNSSKAGHTVAEWRTGKRLPRMTNPPPWATIRAEPKTRKSKPIEWAEATPMFNICNGCANPAGPRAEFCSARCAARVSYRRSVGIPDLAPLYGRAS